MTGQIHRMTDVEYFADPAVNHSTLKVMVERTPAHYRHLMERGHDDPTSDMEFGSAVHSMVLGGPEVVRVDADSWRTKAAQEAGKEARANGAIPLLVEAYQRAEACRDAIANHSIAGKLLASADHLEVVVKWTDAATGVELKAKLDGISGRIVWDVKTTYNADAEAFGRSAAKYGYHSQAAHYEDAARAIGIADPKFLFVVVEKEPPHLVSVIELDPYDVELGHKRNRRALDLYTECVKSGEWPGYGDEVVLCELPRWARISEEANDNEEEMYASW